MGFFSWKTQDTDRSISNKWSCRGAFPVYLVSSTGEKWFEDNYDGYGVFGGKDYYELLAEMNADVLQKHGLAVDRGGGLSLEYDKEIFVEDTIVFPSLTESGEYMGGKPPEGCNDQGFFYDERPFTEDDDLLDDSGFVEGTDVPV